MFQAYNKHVPAYFLSMFSTNSEKHNYSTRQAYHYHNTFHRTTLLKNTILISGPLLWNALDPTIKETATVDKFKRNLKTALLGAGLL